MTAIKHILVPTDGSTGALKAAKYAADLARAFKARVSVLCVQTEDLLISNAWGAADLMVTGPTGTMSVEEIRSILEKRLRENELADTVSALGELEPAADTAIIWGQIADEICKFAEEKNADLIVIGSHGRTGVKRLLLGSVSNSVANLAPCPVTIVR